MEVNPVFKYPMSRLGVNLYKNIVELSPEECLISQNLVWKNGMKKRGGQSLLNTTEAVASTKITGIHRFYYGSSKQRLVACGTKIIKDDEDNTWTDAVTGLTTGLQTHFSTWGSLNKAFICNGTDAMRSWDGSSAATVTISDGVPTMALPYQDRLLTIIGGDLTWSAVFSATGASWETIANCGVRPDTKLYGMCYHAVSNETAGYDAKVLLAGANGMYLFWGSDLRVPFTTGDYQIYTLATSVGCNAPRTMCWTPKGTIWLGIDRQVYFLPFNSATPIPIGTKIQSNWTGQEGIEKMPAAFISSACAVYHDGFYKLSVTRSGQTVNDTQWWLDVNRLYQDEDGLWGPWYGPMKGQSISCFAVQSGPADSGELIAGEANAKGYIYELNKSTDYGDVNYTDASAKAIQVYWYSFYHPLGNESVRKDIHRIEAELLDVLGTVNCDFFDINGSLSTGESFGLSGSAVYYNDEYYNDSYYSSSAPTRQVIDLSPQIRPRRLAVLIKHNSSSDIFELYSVSAEALTAALVFE